MRVFVAVFGAALSASAAMAHCANGTDIKGVLFPAFVGCVSSPDITQCVTNTTGATPECVECVVVEASQCIGTNCATECVGPAANATTCEACGDAKCMAQMQTCVHDDSHPTVSPSSNPSVAAGAVTFPYSLTGDWATNAIIMPELKNRCSYVYQRLIVTYVQATNLLMCKPLNGGAEEIVVTSVLASPSVVACGQQEQIGQSYGVFGGAANVGNATDKSCSYFSRIDSNHVGSSKNAQVSIYRRAASDCGGKVCCPMPMVSTPTDLPATQYTCSSGNCLIAKSSYCASSSNVNVWQIGIGMGIGGVGLLFTTLALLLGVSFAHQG